MKKNYSHSFISVLLGFFTFCLLGLLGLLIAASMQEQGIVEEAGGWMFIFACIGLYFSVKFARLIAKYQHGVAPRGWTSFFDKVVKAFNTTIVLGLVFFVLGLIVGPKGGSEVFLMLMLFAPVMSIYYAFIHPIVKNWVKSIFAPKDPYRVPYPSSGSNRSWIKEKLIPTLISSILPVLLSYMLTNNVTISVSASVIGTLTLFTMGKNA